MAEKKNENEFRGRTWVTRKGVHIDRIASAWLIRRFIDPEAKFKFVAGTRYAAGAGELRFDMFDAEFTHAGDKCTFEVLVDRFQLQEPALQALAEIVHDIDLKDNRYERPEAGGIEPLISGIILTNPDDESRLSRGEAIFGDMYEYFRRKARRRPRGDTRD